MQFQYKLQKGNINSLFLKYGENYKDPCIQWSIDKLNDKATNFSASLFFRDLGTIQKEMTVAMKDLLERECYFDLQTLQVSKAKLPDAYERALDATQRAS